MQPGRRHPNPRRAAVPLHIDLRRVSQVQVANHFEPVLQTLESEVPIDLLRTDIVVPGGVNGLALAPMAHLRRPGIKVIYVTGYDIHGAQKEALGHVLRKPVSRERLLREVSCALGSV